MTVVIVTSEVFMSSFFELAVLLAVVNFDLRYKLNRIIQTIETFKTLIMFPVYLARKLFSQNRPLKTPT